MSFISSHIPSPLSPRKGFPEAPAPLGEEHPIPQQVERLTWSASGLRPPVMTGPTRDLTTPARDLDPPVPRAVPGHHHDTASPGPLGLKVQAGPNGTLACLDMDYEDEALDPWNTEVFHLHGIPRANDLPKGLREEWKQRLGVTPREFFRALFDTTKVKPGATTVSVDRDGGGIRSLDLEIDLNCPTTGKTIGHMDRMLSFPEDSPPEAYHRLFDLNREAQGKGISKDLLANSIKLYEQAGIPRVGLMAALSVGGYAWAKYGFQPKPGRETEELFVTIGDRLSQLRGVPQPVRNVVKRLLEKGDPKAIWAISDLDGVKVRRGEKEVSLGKALLLGTVWKGSLHLDDPEARARFDQYVHSTTEPQSAGRSQ